MEPPPESVEAGELVLKRWQPEWTDDVTAAVIESPPELKPFLPWAQDGYDAEDSRAFIDRAAIRHDAANTASAAVALKAGFTEVERLERAPEAPGETGTDIIRERTT